MLAENLCAFNMLSQSVGNKYVTIRKIAKAARKIARHNSQYSLMESKLITWALTGKCPYTEAQLSQLEITEDDSNLIETLEWVSDNEVKNEVTRLYKKSVKQQHLLECERTDISKPKVDRINILLRMAWLSSY